jgi:hypothetical protein
MPRLSWSCRKARRSSPTPRQNDNSRSEHPRWEPYARIGSVRFCAGGAFDSASEACRQRQPPPFHYKEIIFLVQRDARGVSQTPGLSGSAVALLDQVAPVLHSHERVPLFRLFYGRASEAEAEGDWVGDPKQSPTCGGSVRLRTHTRQTPTDDIGEGPRALVGRGLMTESARYE